MPDPLVTSIPWCQRSQTPHPCYSFRYPIRIRLSFDNMSLVYRYRTINGRGPPTKRPMIDVELINGINHFTTKALIDSGADTCAISSDMAIALGLDLKGERGKSLGVAGSVESVTRDMNIRLSNPHESYNIKVPVRVLFVDERESGSFIPLIGRSVFFDYFRIVFEQKKSKVTLRPETD